MKFVTKNNHYLSLIARSGLIFLGCFVMFFSACIFKPKSKTVAFKTTNQKGYELFVEGKPFLIKGVSYNPAPIGKGYDYDFVSDLKKPWLIDGKLMKDAGFNCIRIYSSGKDLVKTKEFITEMYEKFGIYTVVSDWLGLWDAQGAQYGDHKFQERVQKRILEVVAALKNTKGILFWNLGNENNYTFSGKIGYWTTPEIDAIVDGAKKIEKKAEIYYSFVDKIAGEIKKIDSQHPIALGNGEASFLNIAKRVCKNIDVLSIIIYRGKNFGNLFSTIRSIYDIPMFISEFGCDSYDAQKQIEDQDIQSKFIVSQWEDIYRKTVISGNKTGNCLGGITFEWSDEWWKHSEGYTADWAKHNTEAGWSNGSYYFDIRVEGNMNMNEEWLGIVGLSPKTDSSITLKTGINERLPKKSYYAIKDFFAKISTRP